MTEWNPSSDAEREVAAALAHAKLDAVSFEDAINKLVNVYYGFRSAYDASVKEKTALVGKLATAEAEREGYRSSYDVIVEERGELIRKLSSLESERDGYRKSYEAVTEKLNELQLKLNSLESERDGYRQSYEKVMGERGALREKVAQLEAQLEAARQDATRSVVAPGADNNGMRDVLHGLGRIETAVCLTAASNLASPDNVFPGRPAPGSAASYVICNSIPKAGTYLITELVKALGGHTDIGYHTYSNSLARRSDNGVFDAERRLGSGLWARALPAGYYCASHVEYDGMLELALMQRPEHKMLFIIRDPRDLVISWVDFVYSSASYKKMRRWNAYSSAMGAASYPDDESRIGSSIESLSRTGLDGYFPWIDSPACCVIRFEDLYGELSGIVDERATTPQVDRICAYLELPRPPAERLKTILGSGLTASNRREKIDVYKSRMSQANLAKLSDPAFQKLIIELGYEP